MLLIVGTMLAKAYASSCASYAISLYPFLSSLAVGEALSLSSAVSVLLTLMANLHNV